MKRPRDESPAVDPMVRNYVIAAGIVMGLIAFGAFAAEAQTSFSNSESSSSAQVAVESSANATAQGGTSVSQGGSVYIAGNPSQTRSVVENRQSGTYTVRSAPAVQAPSMGSGHPCAMSGSVGISIIGGGVSGGTMKIDEACLLAQMGQGEAALLMIARRDIEACKALRATGRIPAASVCGKNEQRVTPAPVVSSTPVCPAGSRWDGKGCWARNKAMVRR